MTGDLSRQRSRYLAIAALSVGLLFAIGIAELAVRIALPPPAYYEGHPANVPGLVSPHPERGYTWTPGFVGHMVSLDFETRYSISAEGLRDAPVGEGDARRILAVGDSFTGGEGVEARETWPKQLQKLLNDNPGVEGRIRVINAAVTGYGARQMRQMAEEHVPRFEPEHVIIGLYPRGADRVENPFTLFGEHLVRAREIPNMQRLDGGYIWYSSSFDSEWLVELDLWLQRNLHFGAYVLKLTGRALRLTEGSPTHSEGAQLSAETRLAPVFAELELLADFLADRNVGFTVLVISGQESDGQFADETIALARAVTAYCKRSGLAVVDPLESLESRSDGEAIFRFDNDGHWTVAAHAVAARLLLSQLEQRGR